MHRTSALGTHTLVELSRCDARALDTVERIEAAMLEAARIAGTTVVQSAFHHFSPYGVSGVVVIQESHLTIHTWPEHGFAAVDLFFCDAAIDAGAAIEHLSAALGARSRSARVVARGRPEDLAAIDPQTHPGPMRDARTARAPTTQRSVWLTDRDDAQALSLRHSGEALFRERSAFQTVQVLQSASFGRVLVLDNKIACTERDEAHYHEMLVHPVMQSHPEIRDVLVIGGGDGGAVRELLRYEQTRITVVELDALVLRAAREHLPSMARGLNDPRVSVRVGDGAAFVREAAPESLDLIVLDGVDASGSGERLDTQAMFAACKRALRADGALVTQSESPAFFERALVQVHHGLRAVFDAAHVWPLLFFAPSFPSGAWTHHIATRGAIDPSRPEDPARADAFSAREQLRYYDAAMHRAAFVLPPFVRSLLADAP